jgi:putative FmdB family regulatory protein
MPGFDYICVECGEKFKVSLDLSDDKSIIRCPKCGVEGAERVVYAADRCGDSCSTMFYG